MVKSKRFDKTGLVDSEGKEIRIGDIVGYTTNEYADCQGVVKFGEYMQDGSGGEYSPAKCYGVYVERTKCAPPDWDDDDDDDTVDWYYNRPYRATISPFEFPLRVVKPN